MQSSTDRRRPARVVRYPRLLTSAAVPVPHVVDRLAGEAEELRYLPHWEPRLVSFISRIRRLLRSVLGGGERSLALAPRSRELASPLVQGIGHGV
jgi:hypothetical protein